MHKACLARPLHIKKRFDLFSCIISGTASQLFFHGSFQLSTGRGTTKVDCVKFKGVEGKRGSGDWGREKGRK